MDDDGMSGPPARAPFDETRDGSTCETDAHGAYTVMEIFGVELKVRNPRLAEVLTMEASHALAADVREITDPAAFRRAREELAEAVPDVILSPESPHMHDVARARSELRARADSIARAIGFDTAAGGAWVSPTGISLITRVAERVPTFAAAVDAAEKLAGRLGEQREECSALLLVDSQETADVYKVAIRQRRLHDVMRTISLENLGHVRELVAGDVIDHARALVLLSPLVDIDVGEILSIVRSTSGAASDAAAPDARR